MKRPPPECLPELLKAALGKNARDCAVEMLKAIMKTLHAAGAVLWQATEDAEPEGSPPKGFLFMLATCFPRLGSFGIHNLDFVETIAGKAVHENRPRLVNDIRRDGGKHRDHKFLVANDLNKTVAFPFLFKDGTRGAITVYRRTGGDDFGSKEVALLQRVFDHFPNLLAAAQTRARQELLEKAGEIFQAADRHVPDPKRHADRAWNQCIKGLCKSIAGLFHTAEVTIILRDGEFSDFFVPQAIQTNRSHRKRICTSRWKARSNTRSFTELCLASHKSIRIFDLRDCDREIDEIRRSGFPEFDWSSKDAVESDARVALGEPYDSPDGTDLPPLSFLAVPVISGSTLHGLIRCWIAKPSISYFSKQDQHLLELVAGQLARHCELRSREAQFTVEVTAWRKISDAMDSQKRYSQSPAIRQFGKSSDADDFAVRCFDLLDEVVRDADLNALWLVNDQGNELYCAVYPWVSGDRLATTQAAMSAWSAYVSQRLPLDGDHPTAKSCRLRKELSFSDAAEIQQVRNKLPGLAKQYVIPVGTTTKPLGALELGSLSGHPFPDFALRAARLIAAFLGYHIATRKALSQHQKVEHEKLEAEKFSNDAFQDIMHQMKGPLVEAARRIDEVARSLGRAHPLHPLAEKAGDLVQRSARASRRVGIFGQLSRTGSVNPSRELMDDRQILEVLHDAWNSARLRAHPRMQLRFRESFSKIVDVIPKCSMMDPELLMHAVHNVLDNAIKYSYLGNEVRIEGGRSSTGGWHLVVWNKGIPLKSQEVRLAKLRGWRSPMAQYCTGEGSGIGLWIVDRIMSALGGELLLSPTRSDGWTFVRLQFNPVPLPPTDIMRTKS